ncbi:hypothetical protein V7S43_015997 [Phytophthora oleae]|uniref:Fibronectin type-III domain-containing protein n=1 Tax=Phytophthora oleae TaxID=2107226 RepID=A0ABD3EX36_9STRA
MCVMRHRPRVADYHSKTSPALASSSTYSLIPDALLSGTAYLAHVSACNSLGCNDPTMATPLTLAPPKQIPAIVALFSDSAFSLPSDGGDVITWNGTRKLRSTGSTREEGL